MPRREDHEVRKGHVRHWGKKKKKKKKKVKQRNWRKELGAQGMIEGWVLMCIDVHVWTAITMPSFYAI